MDHLIWPSWPGSPCLSSRPCHPKAPELGGGQVSSFKRNVQCGYQNERQTSQAINKWCLSCMVSNFLEWTSLRVTVPHTEVGTTKIGVYLWVLREEKCLSLFFAAITEYPRLGNLSWSKNYWFMVLEAGTFKASKLDAVGGFVLHHPTAHGKLRWGGGLEETEVSGGETHSLEPFYNQN